VAGVTAAAALAGWPLMVGGAWSKWAVSASHEQTLSGTGARVGWLGVVTGISAGDF